MCYRNIHTCLQDDSAAQCSRNAHDIYLRNVPNKNGYSYLNVLVHFGDTSQMAAVKNN